MDWPFVLAEKFTVWVLRQKILARGVEILENMEQAEAVLMSTGRKAND